MVINIYYKERTPKTNIKKVNVVTSSGQVKGVDLDLDRVAKSRYLTEDDKVRVFKQFGLRYEPKIRFSRNEYIYLFW
jgi:hypothetical protein